MVSVGLDCGRLEVYFSCRQGLRTSLHMRFGGNSCRPCEPKKMSAGCLIGTRFALQQNDGDGGFWGLELLKLVLLSLVVIGVVSPRGCDVQEVSIGD